MNLPKITDIKTQNLGNSILLISSKSGFSSNTMTELIDFVKGDTCKIISNEKDIEQCKEYYDGLMTQGLEQTIIKSGDEIREIIEELNSINTGAKTFKEIAMSSTFIIYEYFIEYYYQKSYRYIGEIFWDLRKEKIKSIFYILRTNLIIYIILSVCLFISFIYFVISMKNMFYSFLNFICIVPSKYLYEDHNFYQEIIKLEENYF